VDSTTPEAPRRVTVTRVRRGWEVSEERNNQVVRRSLFTDWHRVERAIGLHGPGPAADLSTDFSDPTRDDQS
jgi:hypothetical protein